MFERTSGVLLHITSLPGPYGIGSLGQNARHFVDFLEAAGQRYWQILPLVPTGLGNSPYMSTSSFAGNPLLIDLDTLCQMGLLTREEVDAVRVKDPDHVDYAFVWSTRPALLRKAYDRSGGDLRQTAHDFAQSQADWLPDYALFTAIHEHFNAALQEWPDKALIRRTPKAVDSYAGQLKDSVDFHIFLQYLFYTQWNELKAYAKAHGVSIIGDLPIYVSADSADVWTHPELFRLGAGRVPKFVAGVPADAFSATGQRWGNPLYDWNYHEKTGFAWWCGRIRHCLTFYDVIRIDHFRGFDTYWEIPAEEETALKGKWKKGPGMKLIEAFRKNVPEAQFIAEDLGELNDSARQFVKDSGLPGMRVMVDAFHETRGESSFLPHNCPPHAVAYTGTHDTATFVQWLMEQAPEDQRQFASDYLRLRMEEGLGWGVISGAWSTPCNLAIAPFQDVLGLGGDARMNTPGTMGSHNWAWRVRDEALNPDVSSRLRHITWTYRRLR